MKKQKTKTKDSQQAVGHETGVRLKKPSEIDFNLMTGSYHLSYELLKEKIGLKKKFFVVGAYDFYGTTKIYIKDFNGNCVEDSGVPQSLSYSMFKSA